MDRRQFTTFLGILPFCGKPQFDDWKIIYDSPYKNNRINWPKECEKYKDNCGWCCFRVNTEHFTVDEAKHLGPYWYYEYLKNRKILGKYHFIHDGQHDLVILYD